MSLNLISMNIIVNTRGCGFKCVEAHYSLIYMLEGAMDSSSHYIEKSTNMIKTYNEIIKKNKLLD